MIKSIPGWANYFVLLAGYYLLACIIKWITGDKASYLFIFALCQAFCGAYLAKWRWFDGGWHFK